MSSTRKTRSQSLPTEQDEAQQIAQKFISEEILGEQKFNRENKFSSSSKLVISLLSMQLKRQASPFFPDNESKTPSSSKDYSHYYPTTPKKEITSANNHAKKVTVKVTLTTPIIEPDSKGRRHSI